MSLRNGLLRGGCGSGAQSCSLHMVLTHPNTFCEPMSFLGEKREAQIARKVVHKESNTREPSEAFVPKRS